MIQETLEDFRRRYKNTYVFLKIKGENHLVSYESDNEEDFSFYSGKYGNILVDEETAREAISFSFPSAGLYNVDGQAVFFCRNPLRQWKRAPCPDNVSISPILKELQLNIAFPEISFKTMEQVFFPEYPNSLEEVEEVTHSLALNKSFALSASHTENPENWILWFNTSPIGIVDKRTHTISIKYHAFYQETLDYFRKEASPWTVIKSY